MKKHRFDYFASCPTGLEIILADELMHLGAKQVTPARGGVSFEAFHEVALRAVLQSRLASRVFKLLYSFETKNEKDMYHHLTEVKWKSLLEHTQTFKITTIFGGLPQHREEFTNSLFTSMKMKDAIVDWFRHHTGERPSVAKFAPQVPFLLRIDTPNEDGLYPCTVLLDLCGRPLNQRGYRLAQTEAPVKENLAAGIIKLLKWDPTQEAFFDGMCGSGTFVTEAALMAGDIPPSYLKIEEFEKYPDAEDKPWAFLNSQWYLKDEYLQKNFQDELKAAKAQVVAGFKKLQTKFTKISGKEIDQVVLVSCKENLRAAKLADIVTVEHGNALESEPTAKKTLFFCNPPYGERLESGEVEKLNALYKGLGDHWKQKFTGHRAGLFTGNLQMLKQVGLKTSSKLIIFNGDIEGRVAEYKLY